MSWHLPGHKSRQNVRWERDLGQLGAGELAVGFNVRISTSIGSMLKTCR
jgi:hypothetical protein